MVKKNCIICKEEKILDDFYAHSQMADGKLNKCKSCCKIQVKKREEKLRLDKNWVEKERARGREKAKRLYLYKNQKKEIKDKSNKNYKEKFPEKEKAKNAVQRIKVGTGIHKHHWSYNKEHYKDIIKLTVKEHSLLHRYLIYDQERMMYRKSLDLSLLDNKESHILYMRYIFDKYKEEV